MQKFLVAALLCLASTLTYADINIGSWNIQRLGSGDQKSFPALAKVASQFDFLSVQEVMTEPALAELDAALEKASGEKWEHMNSHLLGRGSYKEMYAFFWKPKRVEYVDGAVVYLDRGNKFEREPFSARFRSLENGQTFVAATVHILYGKSESDRTPEIGQLAQYWSWLHEVYPDTKDILLMGDFNLNPANDAWEPLKQVARPLITQGASTLSGKDGMYASLYDNIWVSKSAPMNIKASGIVKYPEIIGWDHEKSRKHVSDHAPVFVTLGKGAGAPVAASHKAEIMKQGTAAFAEGYKQAVNTKNVSVTDVTNPAQLTLASSDKSQVKGNSKSHIYHLPQCGSYAKLSEQNTVLFTSESAAQAAGYRKASNCN